MVNVHNKLTLPYDNELLFCLFVALLFSWWTFITFQTLQSRKIAKGCKQKSKKERKYRWRDGQCWVVVVCTLVMFLSWVHASVIWATFRLHSFSPVMFIGAPGRTSINRVPSDIKMPLQPYHLTWIHFIQNLGTESLKKKSWAVHHSS